jgi:hypothetical protein
MGTTLTSPVLSRSPERAGYTRMQKRRASNPNGSSYRLAPNTIYSTETKSNFTCGS